MARCCKQRHGLKPVDTEMLEGSGFPPQMKPADVAKVVLYLCGDAPAAMNGSLVEVFG